MASGKKRGQQSRDQGAFLGVGCSLRHQLQAEVSETGLPKPRKVGFPAEIEQPEIAALQPTPTAPPVSGTWPSPSREVCPVVFVGL